jgi:mycothiol synthase
MTTQQSYDESRPQLQMVWPEHLLNTPPVVRLADGYSLRTYRPGDEPRFFRLMELAGWPGWDNERLKPSLSRILPDGWFMAVHEASGEIVATAMALHNYSGLQPFQGNLGWLAGDPAHAGYGLGSAVSAAATARLIAAGYRDIRLGTEDFRLAAIRVYLKLGYVPALYRPEMVERWQTICGLLKWPLSYRE